MDLGITGLVAIVAAANKGLGRAVAEELGREGAHVAICARTPATLAETPRTYVNPRPRSFPSGARSHGFRSSCLVRFRGGSPLWPARYLCHQFRWIQLLGEHQAGRLGRCGGPAADEYGLFCPGNSAAHAEKQMGAFNHHHVGGEAAGRRPFALQFRACRRHRPGPHARQ